jgi:hypothetical protein
MSTAATSTGDVAATEMPIVNIDSGAIAPPVVLRNHEAILKLRFNQATRQLPPQATVAPAIGSKSSGHAHIATFTKSSASAFPTCPRTA